MNGNILIFKRKERHLAPSRCHLALQPLVLSSESGELSLVFSLLPWSQSSENGGEHWFIVLYNPFLPDLSPLSPPRPPRCSANAPFLSPSRPCLFSCLGAGLWDVAKLVSGVEIWGRQTTRVCIYHFPPWSCGQVP